MSNVVTNLHPPPRRNIHNLNSLRFEFRMCLNTDNTISISILVNLFSSYAHNILNYNVPFMLVSFCVFAFLRALFMHNERWREERIQLLFLVAIYGIFLTRLQTNLRFLFSDERISFAFAFVSLIDFCNNFALLHTTRKKEKKANEFLYRDYGQEKWLWEVTVKVFQNSI